MPSVFPHPGRLSRSAGIEAAKCNRGRKVAAFGQAGRRDTQVHQIPRGMADVARRGYAFVLLAVDQARHGCGVVGSSLARDSSVRAGRPAAPQLARVAALARMKREAGRRVSPKAVRGRRRNQLPDVQQPDPMIAVLRTTEYAGRIITDG